MVLTPEVIGKEGDKGQIDQAVKALTGRSEVKVVEVRKNYHPDGRIRSFEVDIQ